MNALGLATHESAVAAAGPDVVWSAPIAVARRVTCRLATFGRAMGAQPALQQGLLDKDGRLLARVAVLAERERV